MLKDILFKIARGRAASYFIGYAFEHLCGLMPLERHYETRLVVVFTHPAPSYPLHLLAVPKKRIPSFMHLDFDDPEAGGMALALFEAVQAVTQQKNLAGYSVVVNGGVYQEVTQLHFHIVRENVGNRLPLGADRQADEAISGWGVRLLHFVRNENKTESFLGTEAAVSSPPAETDFTPGGAVVYPYPASMHTFHHVIAPRQLLPGLHAFDFSNPAHTDVLLDMLRAAQNVITKERLNAYRLVLGVSSSGETPNLWFSLLSGE